MSLHVSESLDFLAGGGEMGALTRAFEWSTHPLGAPASWPQSLRTAVSLILNSQHPMWIGWGPEMWFLYNDAYLHVLGREKHPWALGRPASVVWAEIWDVCGPLAEKVIREGQASFVDDVRLFMSRGDFLEETYYSFSYSPIRDESGSVGGLFCPSNDVTPKVVGARRLRTLSELAANALAQKSTEATCASAAAVLEKNVDDIPFALLYLVDPEHPSASLAEAVRVAPGSPLSPVRIDFAGSSEPDGIWPIRAAMLSGRAQRASVSWTRENLPRPADQPVSEAVVLPVASGGQEGPMGVLVAGVNPTRRLDAEYETFYNLVAGHIATAIQNARAAEDQKQRADMLAAIDRAKTIFFSNVSHEFRTPLTLLLAPIEEIISRPPGGVLPENRELLQVAHRNALRLQKLVNTLLDFSRIEAGRADAFYEPTDLAALTADLASTFRSACDKAGLVLIIDCAPLSEPVYVDQEMWEKIVLNLISNAFKYTLAGEIRVSVRADGRSAILAVEDTGVGIPADQLSRVFERFHRVENSLGRTQEGTGIGLALIQELARLHGGAVRASSVPGQGSVFTVEIPLGTSHLPQDRISKGRHLASSAVQATTFVEEALRWLPSQAKDPEEKAVRPDCETQAPRRSTSKRAATILLADDNADMRDYVGRLLDHQYEVLTAADGATALRIAREEMPDLVLSDVMMPGLDGFGLLRELREDERTREIPLILISARAGEEARIEGLEAGADDYITKPFSARELLARVEGTMTLLRVRREARTQLEQLACRLQSALNAARMIAWEWNLNSNQVVFSANADEVLGIADPHTVANEAWKLLHPDDFDAVRSEITEAIESRRDYFAQARLVRPDTGETRWMQIHGSLGYDADGVPVTLTGLLLDITERKQAEEELGVHIDELQRFNRVAVGRELRIIELKQEVNALRARFGLEPEYPLDFEKEPSQTYA